MEKIRTINDLDGFEDICNENTFALTAGDAECKGPADSSTWYEEGEKDQLGRYLSGNASSNSK